MIPKILHYIWFGNNKTELAKECIDSYTLYLPKFEVKEWNESNIDLLNLNDLMKGFYFLFYSKKQYAFCSDIIRLYALLNYGGIYVDTDTKFIKELPDVFIEKPFLCRMNPSQEICNGCIWGCDKKDLFVNACIRWFGEHLQKYSSLYGKKWIFNNILNKFFSLFGYDPKNKETQDILSYRIYASSIFNPMNFISKEISIVENTIAIHYYARSWR
jgi:hypothetical protein